jgi:hypothetical protein
MQVESAPPPESSTMLHFTASEQIYARVFRRLKPNTPLPRVYVQFRRYANANAQIRLENATLTIRMADTLAGAPESVMEALAEILLAKLFRQPVPATSNQCYRSYLNQREVRRNLTLVRQIRGHKRILNPHGANFNIEEMFEQLNFRYFYGLLARPVLGWSVQTSRTLLGHYDASHNAIVLNRRLDQSGTPRLAVEYVLFHEMLHLCYPAEHNGARRRIHTKDFKAAEKLFERLSEARALLRQIS